MSDLSGLTDEELKAKLTPMQYEVARCSGTEPPFQNEYWNHKEPGIYVDVISGDALFSSLDKYDSGSGWPSFTRPIDEDTVTEVEDRTHGTVRKEVRSAGADSHLGHVFPDGPGPAGLRFCINSASMRFVPAEELAEKGYEEFVPAFVEAGILEPAEVDFASPAEAATEVAVLAGGCFWGVEQLFGDLEGVVDTDVGYAGGNAENPSYRQVTSGATGAAEAVRIVFDPAVVSYEDVLRYFFRLHDPTTLNRQHNDVGTQYRSAIFAQSELQKNIARRIIDEVDGSGAFDRPVITEVNMGEGYWSAEDYHQDYLVKNPGGYMCHILRSEES